MIAGGVRSILRLAAALLVLLAVQGCRDDEQDRPLLYQKGSYQGPSEPPLGPQTVEQLRARAANQKY